MSKDWQYERLREISWQRPLTPAEQAELSQWLESHPEARDDWEADRNLTGALANLPNVPVANNFTSRVLAAAQREAAATARGQGRAPSPAQWWLRWLPKAAVAAVVLAAGLLSYHHVQESHREEVARSLTTISQLPAVPGPEVLKDFDAIAALGSTPPADEELLRVMQ